jgi:carboxylesterase type B
MPFWRILVTRRTLPLLFIGAIAIACGSIEAVAQPVGTTTKVVQTRFGAVAGDGSDILAFKGIPYAAPPVGPLRWKPPAPPASWEGVRAANTFGADCMRKPGGSTRASGISEDCLTLNIWAPANLAQNKLPVMVFVYGGSFINGSGSRPLYDGEALACKNVVLVTFNYRTGVFGFLAHRLLTQESSRNSSGNYGLMDIVAALKWVKENIAGFGGDPGRVTLFGESSGASAISLLLTSPLAKGLFERAILESPGAMRPISNLEVAEKAGDVIGNDLDRMRSLSASEVLALTDRMVPAVRGLTTPRALGPINDGWVLRGDERAAFASGRVLPVPLIVGGNSDEGRILSGLGRFTMLRNFARSSQTISGMPRLGQRNYTMQLRIARYLTRSRTFSVTRNSILGSGVWPGSNQGSNQKRSDTFSPAPRRVNCQPQHTPRNWLMYSAICRPRGS